MKARTSQRGFSLIAAIFLMVVVGLLGTFMVVTTGVQQETPVRGLIVARAYHAARSGLEWGIWQAINNGSCVASTSFTINSGALDGYAVTVDCSATTHTENSGGGPQSFDVYVIDATATRGALGDTFYARRQLRAVIRD